MQFRLLGPLEVLAGDEPIAIAAPKQRALLTLLLLHRDECVSVDRIADALWAGSPPSSATKAVQVYVGQVRKALGDGILVTEPGGYRLTLNGHQLDLDRFEGLVGEGSRLLDAGEATAASRALSEADELWRGPALSDLPDAADEARRLDELRLLARERRIEAELALGRADEVAGELQELVHHHPLRERLWELLMLALYRGGRQAEALAAYRDARRRLVDELGVEPGPELRALERAILEQDPAIAGPARPRPASVDRPRRARRTLVACALVLVAAGAAVAALLLVSRNDHRQRVRVPVPGDSLAVVDARSGTLVDAVPAGRAPSAVAAGAGAVWALNADDRTVTRVDVDTKARRTLGVGAAPTDVAFGLGGLWVGVAARVPVAGFAGHTATAVTRLDAETGFAEDPIALPRPRGVVSNGAADHLAFAAGSAWMINPDYSLSRIDPRRNEVVRVLKYVSAVAVASDGRELWVLNDDRTVARIDTAGNRVARRVKVPAGALITLAVGGGSVWALDPAAGRVWRVEASGQLSIDVGAGADAMAFGGGSLWVTNSLQGTLLRIDPGADRVVARIAIGGTPRDVAVAGGRVWVAVAGAGIAAARPAALGDVRPVAAASCAAALRGSAAPDLLIASDLPLQGGPRIPSQQMAAAVLSVLRAHDFKAGRFALAYQSCDDSVARTGLFEHAKCAANAKAFAATPKLIGVVGPMNSDCAFAQVPIVGRAGLALISPSASSPGLTRPVDDAAGRAERRLYPTGVRTFARLATPDDAEGAALAVLARRLRMRRPYVLHDGAFGAAFADTADRALGRLGIRRAGVAAWDWRHGRYGSLARRVRAAHPDGLVICGLLDTDAGAVLRAVRPVLPAGAPVVGCSGLLSSALLFRRAGEAARGVYIARSGLTLDQLPPAGKDFARRLGPDTDVFAVYAAAATEALMRAIARSDGTRISVSAQLLRARAGRSLIGPYRIDPKGDPDPAPVSVSRLDRPGRSTVVVSDDGATRLPPVSPPRALWAGAGG